MNRSSENPLLPLAFVLSLVLAGFVGRLYWLQVVSYKRYATESQDNRLASEPIRALRGEVRARDGTVLVANRQAWDLIYKGGKGEVHFFDRIARLAGIGPGLPQVADGAEAVLKQNLPESAVVGVAEWAAGQPALELRSRIERVYPSHASGNLYGYTRLATEGDEEDGYLIDDLVGDAGLERGLDAVLHGRNGWRYIEVDALGRSVGERTELGQAATPGRNVVLTVDAALQAAAEKAVREAMSDILGQNPAMKLRREARGAIVALDPRTGEVLALASGPHLDPNWFSLRPRPPEATAALLDFDYKPTWNRAIKTYEPGSTFKLVTASALLESGFGNRVFSCTPSYYFGRTWRNWARTFMGPMDARGAIANSCNTWYYQAAVAAGPEAFGETLARRARDFGFGEATGIELPFEQEGPLPSPSATRKAGEVWNPGETLNYSLGQGAMRATPLQIARMLATIVNNGKRPELTLVRAVDGKPQPARPIKQLSGQYWNLLKEGMRQTVLKGTAAHHLGHPSWSRRALFPVPTAGKTGTSQNAQGPGQDHSWYMGFGPYENPNLVVVAFFENGVAGSEVALPAVKKVMAAYWGVGLDERGDWDGQPPTRYRPPVPKLPAPKLPAPKLPAQPGPQAVLGGGRP